MRFDESRDTIGVTRSEPLEYLSVLVDGVAGVGHLGEVHVPHAIALRVEHVEGVGHEPVARRRPDQLMAAPVDVEEVLGGEAGTVSPGDDLGHLVPVGRGAAMGGEARGVGLEDRAGLIEHRQFADVDRRDEHASSRNNGDELLAGKPLERFADRCASDTELDLEGLLAEHVTRREIESDDPPAEALVGLCTQGHVRDTLMIYQVRSGRTHRVDSRTHRQKQQGDSRG